MPSETKFMKSCRGWKKKECSNQYSLQMGSSNCTRSKDEWPNPFMWLLQTHYVTCDIHTDQYPLLRIEDLYKKLSGGQNFTKLDISSAFLQVPLEDDSRKYTIINTQRGFYQYKRLLFGISSSPSTHR